MDLYSQKKPFCRWFYIDLIVQDGAHSSWSWNGKEYGPGKYQRYLVDRKIGGQETLRFYISISDDKISLVFYCVSENIERMKPRSAIKIDLEPE